MTATRMCPVCAGPLPPSHTRPHVFCSHRCRTRAHDIRKRAERLAERLAAAQSALAELDARMEVAD